MSDPVAQRFWAKVRSGPRGCWLWTGPRHRQRGYGVVWLDGVAQLAHRVAWELLAGRSYARRLTHTCRAALCVNPAHLVEVQDPPPCAWCGGAIKSRNAATCSRVCAVNVKRAGMKPPPRPGFRPKPRCSEKRCKAPARARGLCLPHYLKARRAQR